MGSEMCIRDRELIDDDVLCFSRSQNTQREHRVDQGANHLEIPYKDLSGRPSLSLSHSGGPIKLGSLRPVAGWRADQPVLAEVSRIGRPLPNGTEPALAPCIIFDGFMKVFFAEVRPVYIRDVQLGIAYLPQQEVAEPVLAGGSDEQVGVRQPGRIHGGAQCGLVDRVRLQLAVGHRLGEEVNDVLRPSDGKRRYDDLPVAVAGLVDDADEIVFHFDGVSVTPVRVGAFRYQVICPGKGIGRVAEDGQVEAPEVAGVKDAGSPRLKKSEHPQQNQEKTLFYVLEGLQN